MKLRELLIRYNSKGNKSNMTQKNEFQRRLNKYLNNSLLKKVYAKELIDNIEYYPYKEDLTNLFDYLSGIIKLKEIYKDEVLYKLLTFDLPNESYCYFFNKLSFKSRKSFLNLTINTESNIRYDLLQLRIDERKILKNNLDILLNYYKDLFSLRELFKNDKMTLLKINDYINNNGNRIIDNMLDSIYSPKEDRKDGQTYIKMIVDDILKNEQVNYSNITREKTGGFSSVYTINTKVLKIGNNGRVSPSFPNNPYIVKPLLRKVFQLDDKKIFIEVTEKVDNNESNITKEDLYNLYAKLRDLKIRWTDVHTRNVGTLLKDNKIYWHNNLTPTDESLGLEKYRKAEELKKGEVIVLDADFLFDENDKDIKMAVNSFDREFEIRYQKERKLKK